MSESNAVPVKPTPTEVPNDVPDCGDDLSSSSSGEESGEEGKDEVHEPKNKRRKLEFRHLGHVFEYFIPTKKDITQ